ncbi:Dihydrolipoamide acyltransferase component of branched-chain alpha-keto acid dehydrogenase complex, partial [hydrothermal vent metagenome]
MAHTDATNPNEFILPDLGEGVHEAELIKWRVAVGDTVKEHDILAEMETDKALVEVPSPRSGIIKALNGKEGEILNVGNVLVEYEADDSNAASATTESDAQPDSHASAADKTPAEPREDAGTVVGKVGGDL